MSRPLGREAFTRPNFWINVRLYTFYKEDPLKFAAYAAKKRVYVQVIFRALNAQKYTAQHTCSSAKDQIGLHQPFSPPPLFFFKPAVHSPPKWKHRQKSLPNVRVSSENKTIFG